MRLKKILYVGMRYDYGNPHRGLSFEEKNFHDSLRRYAGVQVLHFDFMAQAQKHGVQVMSEKLVSLVREQKPDLLFGVFFNEAVDPTKESIRFITRHTGTITCLWMCDDNWRFESYSQHWAQHVHYVVTTAASALPKYERIGCKHKVIKSQWACNESLYFPYDIERDKDVTFIGQPHSNRQQIIDHLRELGLNVSVYGWGWRDRPRLPFNEMVRMFSRTKVNLNLSNASANGSQQIKGRNFEVPGCRAFLLTGQAENLEEYYEPGREVVIYEDLEDLADKARFYLRNDREREAIAARAYERTLKEHTWRHRFGDIFRIVGL